MDGVGARRKVAAWGTSLLLASALILVAAPAASAKYSNCRFRHYAFRDHHAFFGVTAPDVSAGSFKYRDCALGRMAAYHVGLYRYDLDWAGVETSPGTYDFSFYDTLVAQLAEHRIRFLPILGDPPAFYTSAPRHKPLPGWYAPTSDSAFAQFAAQAVRRYGPNGTFWNQYPQFPYEPIRVWQIWNEPSLYIYWEPRPSAAAYTRLLKAAYQAIKAVDARATVLTAGLPWFSLGVFASRYYRSMFRHGAGRWFDGLAFHAYAPGPLLADQRVELVRTLMNRHGARRKSLWITEFGWAVNGPPSPYTVGRQQASHTWRFLSYIRRNRRRLRLGAVVYYGWRDPRGVSAAIDFFGYHTGLFAPSGRPRRVSGVISYFARRLDR